MQERRRQFTSSARAQPSSPAFPFSALGTNGVTLHSPLASPTFGNFQHSSELVEDASMASDTSSVPSNKPPMTDDELVALVKEQLHADEERQAKVTAASAGELPRESQDGSTMDLSHRNVAALPVEVIVLIRDRVER